MSDINKHPVLRKLYEVVVDEDGCEWCAKHIPNGAKLVNDFRDEGEVKEIGE